MSEKSYFDISWYDLTLYYVNSLDQSDQWKCDHCNLTFSQPEYRYTLSIKLTDHTGSLWINAYDNVAKLIIGMIFKHY